MENKDYKMIMLILICLAVVTIGGSFAYFYSVVTGTGNTTNNTTSTTAVSLGTVNYDGETTFTGANIYPGYIGIQTFTISPGNTGTGRYEIDLASTLPTEFGEDVEITLYKTTDPTNNYLTKTTGTLTQNGNQFYQEDTLTTTGTLTTVYSGTLTNNSQIILSEEDFTIPGLSTTTYYLVYHYKNNGNQNNQEGKAFSGKVTVNLLTPLNYKYNTTAVETITTLASSGDASLVSDGTTDNNLRYIGATPNNYVSFNGELWRIIGVMNNIDNGSGTKETRLKIIRSESIGNYSWDSSESTINSGYGINEWSQADLMTELNSGAYWNRTSGTCYNDQNNATTTCDFSSIGLTSASQSMIGNALWNTGSQGSNDFTATATGLVSNFYTYERSSDNGKICTQGDTYCNDTVSRTTTWIGKIGLMYPSDYGYATGGGSTTNRASCLAKELYNWNSSSYSDCKTNDWLFNSSYQWTIMPTAYSLSATHVFTVYSDGNVYSDGAYLASAVRPVGYLDSKTQILSGTGTSSDPYILSA